MSPSSPSSGSNLASYGDLLGFDREHVWHPYTSMNNPARVRLVTGASGVRIALDDGSSLIDAMASWWSAVHGYNHPVLNDALARQAQSMAHVMFGGLTHEPAVRLVERLIQLTPEGLDHVFLADSGSVSVEVAIKMALQYQRGIGRPERARLLTVRGGYHGDTFGCMSVCDPVGGMHSMFTGVLAPQVFADRPPSGEGGIPAWAEEFRRLAAIHSRELAGIVVEPILQGAGGMFVYPPSCLQVMRDVADEHDLVLVFDEIATGFGRTGPLFAAEGAQVTPDVMCLGKAMTGGYLSLAAVLCSSAVARGISASEAAVLMHGPTFMGNPLACAVALANLELLESNDWRTEVSRIHAGLTTGLAPLRELAGVVDVRTIGAVGVVELDHHVELDRAIDAAAAQGVWLRPFRNLIYTMPPYITDDDDLATICAAIGEAVGVA